MISNTYKDYLDFLISLGIVFYFTGILRDESIILIRSLDTKKAYHISRANDFSLAVV